LTIKRLPIIDLSSLAALRNLLAMGSSISVFCFQFKGLFEFSSPVLRKLRDFDRSIMKLLLISNAIEFLNRGELSAANLLVSAFIPSLADPRYRKVIDFSAVNFRTFCHFIRI
jgi:hypothetical protein